MASRVVETSFDIDSPLRAAERSARASDLRLETLELENVRIRGQRPGDLKAWGRAIADNLTAASLTRTIDGTSTLMLTLDDKLVRLADGRARRQLSSHPALLDLRNDGRLDAVQLPLDTLMWRLVKAEKQGDELKLTFEEEAIALLRQHSGHLAVSRANTTRAEFAHRLVLEVKDVALPFYSPEEHFAQAAARTPRDRTTRDSQRKPGFADGVKLKIAGATADVQQLREVETALTVADEEDAIGRARQALVVAGIGESGFRAIMNRGGSPYGGVFQGNVRGGVFELHDTEGMARHFLKGGKGFQAGGAIAAAAAHPGWSAGTIAYNVEGDLQNFHGDKAKAEHFYQQHIDEAHKILTAWNGTADGSSSSDRTVIKPYQFMRGLPGKRENSWQALQRLAEEVGWRCFVVGGVVYFISDEALFMSRARMEISEATDGVDYIDFDIDQGKTVEQVTVSCHASRWAAPPGTIVAIRDMGLPDGRWLVQTVERPDLFDAATTITLIKPTARKREPAADTIQVPRSVHGDASDAVTSAHLAARHLAGLKIPYVWGGGHGVDLDDYAPRSGLDCSGAVCMVLHRAGLFGDRATNSTGLETWGTPGKGRQMTVYANADHTFLVFDLPGKKPQAWEARHHGTLVDFSGRADRPNFEQGFVARHAAGT